MLTCWSATDAWRSGRAASRCQRASAKANSITVAVASVGRPVSRHDQLMDSLALSLSLSLRALAQLPGHNPNKWSSCSARARRPAAFLR
jgi:hypothetical protein